MLSDLILDIYLQLNMELNYFKDQEDNFNCQVDESVHKELQDPINLSLNQKETFKKPKMLTFRTTNFIHNTNYISHNKLNSIQK